MRNPNAVTLSKTDMTGLYDPYDPTNMEYRGYIGYVEDGKYYFGLKPGQSVLVSLPLVFWNGGRIFILANDEYLTPSTAPNPLSYDPNSERSIAPAETSDDSISNGVVMWYRAGSAVNFVDDIQAQLAEWTIRDHGYLVNPQITTKTKG